MRISQHSQKFINSHRFQRSRILSRLSALVGIPASPGTRLLSRQALGESFFLRKVATQKLPTTTATRSLDLGSGTQPRNPFGCTEIFGVDLLRSENPKIKSCNIAAEDLPFPNNYFHVITAFDLIEHIPRVAPGTRRYFPFIELMNEVHRTLAPGGIFYARTPAYPFPESFSDPTHVNIITEDTLPHYFSRPHLEASKYGFKGAFTVADQAWWDCWLLTALVKPRE